MKKLKLVVVLFLLFSCNNKEDKVFDNSLLLGNWVSLSNDTYQEYFQAIIRLGGTSFKDRCSLMKLRKLDSNDKEVLTGIKNIIGTSDPVPKGLRRRC
mgnify:CR=1 FL=1